MTDIAQKVAPVQTGPEPGFGVPPSLIQYKAFHRDVSTEQLVRFFVDLNEAFSTSTSEQAAQKIIWAPMHYKGLNDQAYVRLRMEDRPNFNVQDPENSEYLYLTDVAFLLDSAVYRISQFRIDEAKKAVGQYGNNYFLRFAQDIDQTYSDDKLRQGDNFSRLRVGIQAVLQALQVALESQKPQKEEKVITLDSLVAHIISADPMKLWKDGVKLRDVALVFRQTLIGDVLVHFQRPPFTNFKVEGQDFPVPELRKVFNAYYTRFRAVYLKLPPVTRKKVKEVHQTILSQAEPQLVWFRDSDLSTNPKSVADRNTNEQYIIFFDEVFKALQADAETIEETAGETEGDGGAEDPLSNIDPDLLSEEQLKQLLRQNSAEQLVSELLADELIEKTEQYSHLVPEITAAVSNNVFFLIALNQVFDSFVSERKEAAETFRQSTQAQTESGTPPLPTDTEPNTIHYDPETRRFLVTPSGKAHFLELVAEVIAAFYEAAGGDEFDAGEFLATIIGDAAETQREAVESFESEQANVPDGSKLEELLEAYMASDEYKTTYEGEDGPQTTLDLWLKMSLNERKAFLAAQAKDEFRFLIGLSHELAGGVIEQYLKSEGVEVKLDDVRSEQIYLRDFISDFILEQPLDYYAQLRDYALGAMPTTFDEAQGFWADLEQLLSNRFIAVILPGLRSAIEKAIRAQERDYAGRLRALGIEGNYKTAFDQSVSALLIYIRDPESFIETLDVAAVERIFSIVITEEQLEEFKKLAIYYIKLERTKLALATGLVANNEFNQENYDQIKNSVGVHGAERAASVLFQPYGETPDETELAELQRDDPEEYARYQHRRKYLEAIWREIDEEERARIAEYYNQLDASQPPTEFTAYFIFSPEYQAYEAEELETTTEGGGGVAKDESGAKKEKRKKGRRKRGKKSAAKAAFDNVEKQVNDLLGKGLQAAGNAIVPGLGTALKVGADVLERVTGIRLVDLAKIALAIAAVIAAITLYLVLTTWLGLLGFLLAGTAGAIALNAFVSQYPILQKINTAFGGPLGLYNQVINQPSAAERVTSVGLDPYREGQAGSVGAVSASGTTLGVQTVSLNVVAASAAGVTITMSMVIVSGSMRNALLQSLPTVDEEGQTSPYLDVDKKAIPGTDFSSFAENPQFPQDVVYQITITAKDEYRVTIPLGTHNDPSLIDTISVNINEDERPGASQPPAHNVQRTFGDLVNSNCSSEVYSGPRGQEYIDLLRNEGFFSGEYLPEDAITNISFETEFSGTLTLEPGETIVFPPYCETYDENYQHSNVTNTLSLELIAEDTANPTAETVSSTARTSEVLCFGLCPQFAQGCWPTNGTIGSEPFDPSLYTHSTSDAVDIRANLGEPVFTPFSGEAYYYPNGQGVFASQDAYGNHVFLLTDDIAGQRFALIFAHLSSLGGAGTQRVEVGDFIGRVGSTGNSTGPHLHYELRVESQAYPELRNPPGSSVDWFHQFQGFTIRQMGPNGPQPYFTGTTYLNSGVAGVRQRPTILDTIVPDGPINRGTPVRTCWEESGTN